MKDKKKFPKLEKGGIVRKLMIPNLFGEPPETPLPEGYVYDKEAMEELKKAFEREANETSYIYKERIEDLTRACEDFAIGVKKKLTPIIKQMTEKINKTREELEFGDVFDE